MSIDESDKDTDECLFFLASPISSGDDSSRFLQIDMETGVDTVDVLIPWCLTFVNSIVEKFRHGGSSRIAHTIM